MFGILPYIPNYVNSTSINFHKGLNRWNHDLNIFCQNFNTKKLLFTLIFIYICCCRNKISSRLTINSINIIFYKINFNTDALLFTFTFIYRTRNKINCNTLTNIKCWCTKVINYFYGNRVNCELQRDTYKHCACINICLLYTSDAADE